MPDPSPPCFSGLLSVNACTNDRGNFRSKCRGNERGVASIDILVVAFRGLASFGRGPIPPGFELD